MGPELEKQERPFTEDPGASNRLKPVEAKPVPQEPVDEAGDCLDTSWGPL